MIKMAERTQPSERERDIRDDFGFMRGKKYIEGDHEFEFSDILPGEGISGSKGVENPGNWFFRFVYPGREDIDRYVRVYPDACEAGLCTPGAVEASFDRFRVPVEVKYQMSLNNLFRGKTYKFKEIILSYDSVSVRDDIPEVWPLDNPGSWKISLTGNHGEKIEMPLFPGAVKWGFCTQEDLQSIFINWR